MGDSLFGNDNRHTRFRYTLDHHLQFTMLDVCVKCSLETETLISAWQPIPTLVLKGPMWLVHLTHKANFCPATFLPFAGFAI
jgi:hypothetical protein